MDFSRLKAEGFEQVVFFQDAEVGLQAIVAMHSTVMGPAVGGCRMYPYANTADAVNDVLRLGRGMTYKATLAGLAWGGGKGVIIADPKTQKNPKMLKRYGEFVERLGGHYVTAKDVGIGSEDLRIVKSATSHVLGIEGEPGSSGDPSPATAWGTFNGILACASFAWGSENLKDKVVSLQGLGSVNSYLLPYLRNAGAKMIACDVDEAAIRRAKDLAPGIEIVAPDAIYDVRSDIFSPGAMGASITATTLPKIQAKIIAGAANNQLATEAEGHELHKRGVVYAPDYAINAGGLINIYHERAGAPAYDKQRAFDHVEKIKDTIRLILDRSKSENTPSFQIADRIVEERLAAAKKRN